MATAKKHPHRTRWGWRSILLVAIMLGVVAGWYWRVPVLGYSSTGAAFGARTACSCRYVAGRAMGDCKKDFDRRMVMVFVRDDVDEKSVTATVPLLASETARYSPGKGCVLDAWED
ncbi:MAG: hypothetical protein RLZZ08_375 [Pseudomonadota bacterium]|jgi:hypothetical protein